MNIALTPLLDRRKFRDPATTADGIARATVELGALTTLWFNTGSLCDLTCMHCYIESSPKNDRLSYLTPDDVALYLNEIATRRLRLHRSREGRPPARRVPDPAEYKTYNLQWAHDLHL